MSGDHKILKWNPKEKRKFSFSAWWYFVIHKTLFGKIDDLIRDFMRGMHNLFKWRKIIWKDRDWDKYYIFEVLKFKIKNTRDYILKADRIIDFQQDQIKRYTTICLKLIDAIQDGTYEMEYADFFESEFEFIPLDKPYYNELTGKYEKMFEMKIKEISSVPGPYFKKYSRIFKIVKKEIENDEENRDDQKYIAKKIANKNHDRAVKLLFTILERYCQTWWD